MCCKMKLVIFNCQIDDNDNVTTGHAEKNKDASRAAFRFLRAKQSRGIDDTDDFRRCLNNEDNERKRRRNDIRDIGGKGKIREEVRVREKEREGRSNEGSITMEVS